MSLPMAELLGRKPEAAGAGAVRGSGALRGIGLLAKLEAGVEIGLLEAGVLAGALEAVEALEAGAEEEEVLLLVLAVVSAEPCAVSVWSVSNNESSPLRRNIEFLPNGCFVVNGHT